MAEEVTTMKCPLRIKDGEFCDCYGEKCTAYYEIPSGCGPDNHDARPMCMEIMKKYPETTHSVYFVQTPYQEIK